MEEGSNQPVQMVQSKLKNYKDLARVTPVFVIASPGLLQPIKSRNEGAHPEKALTDTEQDLQQPISLSSQPLSINAPLQCPAPCT